MPVNPSSKTCVQDEMEIWKQGKLHSGSGNLVPPGEKGRKQALAISLSACKKTNFVERLSNIGLSPKSLELAEKMLIELPDWEKQFETGQTDAKVIRENKTTLAVGLPDMDIDNRSGKQKGDQGKQKEQDSRSLNAVAVPKGNPQQGPRSRSDLVGLRMFQELKPLTGECNQAEKRKQRQQQRTPEQKKGDLERAKELQNKPVAPNVNREAVAQKAAETRKKCKTQGPGSKVPNTYPAGAGVGAGVGASGGFSEGVLDKVRELLYEETSKTDSGSKSGGQDCRPRPQPRSPEQRQSTQQAQQAAQQQGQTFDKMPPQQQRQAAQQGGQAPRQAKPPLCPQ